MQFLLAKLMFRKSPKAAMKALDQNASDAQTYDLSPFCTCLLANTRCSYQHFSWVYALRFLRASHSLSLGTLADSHAAIENLQNVAKLAQQQNDREILITSYLMEALAHLRSNDDDAMVGAQRAIGAVWQYQLDSSSNSIPQLLGLAHIIDVTCSIRQDVPRVTQDKLKKMQQFMDLALKDSASWSHTSDRIAIPINRTQKSSQYVSPDTVMILGIGEDGRDNLMLSFLNMKDASSLM
jgi:hypothetical protein